MDEVVVESRELAFAACAWYLHEHGVAAARRAVAHVVNAREPPPRRRVVLMADGAGAVAVDVSPGQTAIVEYVVTTHGEFATDGRPERFRDLRLMGDGAAIGVLIETALDEYRRVVLAAGRHEDGSATLDMHEWDDECWVRGRPGRPRPLSTLHLTRPALEVLADVKQFVASRPAFDRLGVAPTRVYMLHGVPGSGKSSLARCVATELGYGLATLRFGAGTTDEEVRRALATLPSRCVACIEDVDCLFAERRPTASPAMTFAGLLAALDECGCDTGEPVAVFMTTNRLAALDPALTRRIDHVVQFGYATKAQARSMYEVMFPGRWDFETFWAGTCEGKRFPMSALQKHLLKALMGGDPLSRSFDDLVACAASDATPAMYG